MIRDNSPVLTDEEARAALEKCIEQVRRNLGEFTTSSQNHSSVNNFYPQCKNDQWTTGFWPGEIWLAYEYTKDEAFKNAALEHVKSMNYRIENKISSTTVPLVYVPLEIFLRFNSLHHGIKNQKNTMTIKTIEIQRKLFLIEYGRLGNNLA